MTPDSPLAAPGVGTVRAPVAPVLAEPLIASVQISQLLAGHRVELIEKRDDWFLSRGSDGYEGWIHRGFLSAASYNGARTLLSLGCIAVNGVGARALPLGAILAPDERVATGEAISGSERADRFPRHAPAITRSATELFRGTSYLWGGVTPWGADCSGFVQSIFGLHGVQLPRDAWQQSGVGRGAGPLESLEPADLAFFTEESDGRVSHVAISLGDGRLAHCALGRGGFALEELRNSADPYVAKLMERFKVARRVL